MSVQYCLTHSQNVLSIKDEGHVIGQRVGKCGAFEALGRLSARFFVVFTSDGDCPPQANEGNYGALPCVSMKFEEHGVMI